MLLYSSVVSPHSVPCYKFPTPELRTVLICSLQSLLVLKTDLAHALPLNNLAHKDALMWL